VGGSSAKRNKNESHAICTESVSIPQGKIAVFGMSIIIARAMPQKKQ
jgi:hypothetical protein